MNLRTILIGISVRKRLAVLSLILAVGLVSGTPGWAKESALLYDSIEAIAKTACTKVPTKNGILVLDIQDLDGRVTYLNRYLTDQMTIALSNTVESKRSSALSQRVVEIQMENAIKERIQFLQKKQEEVQEARNIGDSEKKPELSVWEKLQQSVESE